ncbi:SusC/RagA family TonB-linked outer membrane protein [Chitinophaga sancti]|uniref:SusC/RagA family TonB-linked outer membrane protein n=1 Tax=Chitinophaga sancti TaxID=1004 RepID=UPI003F7A39BF
MLFNHWANNFISRKSLCVSVSLFLVLIFVSIQSFAQVTISAKNIPLGQAFDQLSKQTGYTFFYNNKDIRKLGKVDIALKNVSLETALGQLLKGLPLNWHIVDKTVVIRGTTPAAIQDTVKEISGIVRNRLNEPLPRVSIRVQNDVYQTNNEGAYNIKLVDEDTPISFSFIGYQSAVYRAGQAKNGRLNVVLEDAKIGLNEVVVNGYQEIHRDNYTGTAVVVSGEKLKEISPQNLLQGMQMVDPSFRILNNNFNGSNPNSMPVINVRGSSALPTGSDGILRRDNISSSVNLPAFILDGYEVSLEKVFDLDMNRIATVTLLKDAAATAIYGSRAANGVMVITTKVPANGKLQVTYNHETNFNSPDLTDYHVLNAAQKLQYEQQAGVYDAGLQKVPQDGLDVLYYEKLKNVAGGVNTYWLSQPLRTAIGQKHGVYLQGGAENFRYGIDLRYQTRPGVMKGSSRDQYSGGMNFSYNLSNRIKFQNELTITQVKSKESPYGSFADYVKTNPYYRITDDNGNVIRELETWSDRNADGGAYQYDYVLNPLYNSTLSSFNTNNYTEIIDNFAAEFEIAKGLRVRGQMSMTSRQSNGDNFLSPLANEFYFYAASETDQKGSYTSSRMKETYWDGNIRLNYVKQLHDHNINLVAGANIRTELSDYADFTAIGFPNDRFTSVGFAKGYAEGAHPRSNIEKSRLFGDFISTNYSYKDRYLMDATLRTDGSSKFGTANRLAPFWSLGVGWNLHKESWFDNDVISQLRLRFTTGLTGSVQFSPYLSRTTYSYDQSNWYSSGIGATVGNYGNSNLGWQKTRSTDFGFDLGLFKDRIFLSPRIYYKLTKDLLADISIAPSTGFSSYKENLGDMENKGIELSLRAVVIQNKDWGVNIYANLVHNTNKIVRISNSLEAYNNKVNQEQATNSKYKGVPLLRYKEGQSYDAIYAVRSLGIDPENGKEVFVKRDGSLSYQWDARDVNVVGDATPFAQGSFGGTFHYRKFMMSLNFQTEFGGDMYNQTLVDRVENANPRYNVDSRVFAEKWKHPGDKTFYKNIYDWGQTQVSSRFIQPNNVLSLQSIYCSYDLRVVKRMVRLGMTANDILRWSSVEQERGIDYPFARSVTFSLQAQF